MVDTDRSGYELSGTRLVPDSEVTTTMRHYKRFGGSVKQVILFAEYIERATGEEYFRPGWQIVWASGEVQEIIFDELLPDQALAMDQAFVRLGDRFSPLPPYIYDWAIDLC